ncbi:uncharacterized protein MELLADRAFT_105428 [Melampsora larici-populina 98AG31]|uniref:Secreted protein n=1 Tax=Melampsora larici-populina (strain 98AG31 / pathotype 3-4-7) TaxID=747676 RepID=F4RI37_MELLP|nr:uncharacterized protein MELLADRAFT_105428 [Melampsora larici-populina 98AG31]EGG07932.1 secreted protein [Melampsora larici-populina 98AG31]
MHSSSLQQTLLMVILLVTVICASPFPNPQNDVNTPVENPTLANQINSSPPPTEQKTEDEENKEPADHKKALSELISNNIDVARLNQIVKKLSQNELSSEEIIGLAQNGTKIEFQQTKHRTYLSEHPLDQSKREENDQASEKLGPIIEQIQQHFNDIANDPSQVKPNLAEIIRLRSEALPLAMIIISNVLSNGTRT